LPPHEIESVAKDLDAFVLPGSPADIDPRKFRAPAHPEAGEADLLRERTDSALLRHALPAGKPILAICYGIQSMNVHLGGSLIQDIQSEVRFPLTHSSPDHGDAKHPVNIRSGSLAQLVSEPQVVVNSLHHQAVGRVGRGLRVTAHAPDGTIEAVEWVRGPGWALGVQWHPERMPDDPLAQKLFQKLVKEAAKAAGVAEPVAKKSPAAKVLRSKAAKSRPKVKAKPASRATKKPAKKLSNSRASKANGKARRRK
jgi:putative glutamine amidotransferase